MARTVIQQKRFAGGLSHGEKEGINSSFLWSRSMDYRSSPGKLKILPSTAKVSGSVVVDLIMDGDRQSTDAYFYGNTGHIYSRDNSEVWTDLRTVNNSTGNGMKYFGEDLYLYYTSDTVIGRYGPFGGTKNFTDDFLGAEGGVPLNTASLDLESGSSHYATAADHSSLSITGDITSEGCFKHESLPAAGSSMVLISKWTKQNDDRSYMFDLAAVSAKFGDGGDGALTVSSNTTQAPTDSACTGTATTYSLPATNASFAAGDKLLIHQSRGTGVGNWERNEISSYTAGTITLTDPLSNTYSSNHVSKAQVIVLKEYTNVTVNSGITWTAKAWNGTVGGILCFLANGTVTVTGTITATGRGFRGGAGVGTTTIAFAGEGTAGVTIQKSVANGNGGGGGQASGSGQSSGGGGGGDGTSGSNGTGTGTIGVGGNSVGTADLTTMVFGGAGGGGSGDGVATPPTGGTGGNGGGIIFFYGITITINTGSSIISRGNNGAAGGATAGGGGGGASGSVLLKAQIATLGTNLVTAPTSLGGSNTGNGGNGSIGRIHLDYYTSYTGTTNPALDSIQDDSLASQTVYQLRFHVSTDGTSANSETLFKQITDPVLATWYRYAVKWDASAATAEFFIDGVSQGTTTGAKTSISDNASLFAIGASHNASGNDENHFDGKIDDIRVWNDLRTDSELDTYKEIELGGSETGLVAYYEVDSSTADSSANSNTLTLQNSPTYDTDDVPFSSPTTRNDLDQSLDTSGNTYTLPTAISEAATARQTFIPTKDPQKSIEVLVADNGSGDWTLTVHDALNREIVTATIVNANVVAGDIEFIFSTTWRPHIGATYHFHIIDTTGDGTVTTTTDASLETVDFHTYCSFLVDDTFHPIEHHAEKLYIGNERYLATWDGSTYTHNTLILPSGYRIRCLGIWREYLVMGVTLGTNIEDNDIGYLFFWDGYHTTYNFYIKVPEGGINAIQSGDPMYFIAGYSGDFMKYEGGKPKKIRRMPKVGTSVVEVNPKAIAMWRALTRIGFAMDSTSTAIERGVYSWGSLFTELPETLSFDYPLSLAITQSTTLEIGMLFPMGSSLFVSWRSGSSYGVDSVTPTNDPYSTATIEFLISDAGKIWQEKQAHVIRSYFKALVSGDSVTHKYKRDRDSGWTSDSAVTTTGLKVAETPLPTKGNRYNELQVAIDLATTGSTTPEVYGWAVSIDEMTRERIP